MIQPSAVVFFVFPALDLKARFFNVLTRPTAASHAHRSFWGGCEQLKDRSQPPPPVLDPNGWLFWCCNSFMNSLLGIKILVSVNPRKRLGNSNFSRRIRLENHNQEQAKHEVAR